MQGNFLNSRKNMEGQMSNSAVNRAAEQKRSRAKGLIRRLTTELLFYWFTALLLFFTANLSEAANVKVIPSATRVSPGESFYIDINAENIPSEGLGAVQFRLNVVAQGSTVAGVSDASQGKATDVSVSAPLLIGLPAATRSGIGDFFWNASGPHGILVMDNESLNNGSALYTFGHTNGSTPPSGGGSVARFHFVVGKDVAAEKIVITLSDVMLLDTGVKYSLDTNTGATIELRCITKVPNLLGLSRIDAQAALQGAGLLAGNIYEIDNQNKAYALNRALTQSYAAGTSVLCETPVDLAINTAPSEVGSASASDKPNDESGGVILSWTPSISTDTAGYRIYLGSQLLTEIRNPGSTGTEISGLPIGQVSQIKITSFDSFGNESSGVPVSATAVDDVAPGITIDGVVEGAFYSSSVLPSISVIDANLSAKEILLNGISYAMAAIGIEGNYTLKVSATDSSGNTTTKEIHFVIDKTPPSSALTVADPKFTVSGNTYVSGVTAFAVSGEDKGVILSGIDRLEYRINNGSWRKYQSPFNLAGLADGVIAIDYRAIDMAGNIEDKHTLTVNADNTSPASSISIGTPQYQANGNLYISVGTEINITAADALSGVNSIEYSIDGSSFTSYISPITLASYPEGSHTISYRSIDNLGNTEDAQTLIVIIDKTPPQTAISASDPLIEGVINTVSPKTRFTFSSSDNLSGVKEISYKIDSSSWQRYPANFSLSGLAAGAHTITYKAMDNVLNEEIEKTITVRLIVIDVQKGLSSEPVVLAGVWTDENGSDTAQKQADMNNLNSVLFSLGLSYYMAPNNEEFVEAVRSGRYNTYLLVDYKEPLLGEEIRESVYYGSGLIFIKTSPQADPFLDDVFGVKFTGKTTDSGLPVNLVESPISAGGTINSSGKGVVSTITSDTAQSFGYVVDKRDTFDSIVSNQYGRGKTILYNFDLLYTTDRSRLENLISNSLNYVKPSEQYPTALESMSVKISADNSTERVDIKLIETMPAGTSVDSISPNASVTENTITWQKYLNIREKAAFRYYLNIPDASGDYTTDTELRYSNNGEYRLYGNYTLTFNIKNSSAELLRTIMSELSGLSANNTADADRITKAAAGLSAISANASNRKDAEENIKLITNATDEIRKLSFDAPDVRLKLEELLRIWEKKWYLMKE